MQGGDHFERVNRSCSTNGAGKSTAIECILGTKKAESGDACILGFDARKNRRKLFQKVGVQFQEGDYQLEIKVFELCEETACLYTNNEKMAGVIASALYFPMLVFSGTTLPFEVMPDMLQKIVAFFPLTQGIQLMKATFLGLPADNLWLPITVMGAATIICTGLAVKCFKWE